MLLIKAIVAVGTVLILTTFMTMLSKGRFKKKNPFIAMMEMARPIHVVKNSRPED